MADAKARKKAIQKASAQVHAGGAFARRAPGHDTRVKRSAKTASAASGRRTVNRAP
jgi:hypothetical protein